MTDDSKKIYEKLLDLIQEISLLNSCMSLLDWDEKTYIPKGGVEHGGIN